MNFNVNKIEAINYDLVTLSEVFPELKDYDKLGSDYKMFEVLYQEGDVLLCALATQSRVQFFHMDTQAKTFEAFATLTGYDNEVISLDVRAMRMVYVSMAKEDNVRHGVFDSAWGAFKHSFYLPQDEEVLFLNHDYCLISKNDEAWQFEGEKWVYHEDKDELFLYEVKTKNKYPIHDVRLKNTWHTVENQMLVETEDKTYFVNVPFNMDPYEYEEILNSGKEALQVCDTNISMIEFDQFVKEVKANKTELSLNSLLNFEKEACLFSNMPELATETRRFALYDFKEKTITRYAFDTENSNCILKELDTTSIAALENSYNVVAKADDILVHKDDSVTLLIQDKTIPSSNHETFFYTDGQYYFFIDWSEEENKEDSYKEYLVVKDEKGKEILKREGFYILIEPLKLFLQI